MEYQHTHTQHTHTYHTPPWAPRSVPPYCSNHWSCVDLLEKLRGFGWHSNRSSSPKYPPPYIHTMWNDTVMQQVIYATMGPNDIHCLVCNHGNCDTVELLQCKLRIGWHSNKLLILGVIGEGFCCLPTQFKWPYLCLWSLLHHSLTVALRLIDPRPLWEVVVAGSGWVVTTRSSFGLSPCFLKEGAGREKMKWITFWFLNVTPTHLTWSS